MRVETRSWSTRSSRSTRTRAKVLLTLALIGTMAALIGFRAGIPASTAAASAARQLETADFSSTHTQGSWSRAPVITVGWPDDSGSSTDDTLYSHSFTHGATGDPDLTPDTDDSDRSATSDSLSDGSWYFNIRAMDSTLDPGTTAHYGPMGIDRVKPTVTFDADAPLHGAYVKGGLKLPVLVSDDRSGVSQVEAVKGGALSLTMDTIAPFAPVVDTKKLANGKHNITARVFDRAGNTADVKRTYRVDNYLPRTYAPKKAAVTKGENVRLHYRVKDAYTKLAFVTIKLKTLKGKTKKTIKVGWKKPGAASYQTYRAALTPGTYRFHVYARDKAGNKQFNVAKNKLAISDDAKPLLGRTIMLDAGHQRRGNSGLEPIGPGSSKKKAKVTSGATGVATRIPEYKVVLAITLRTKTALEKKGARVLLTRSRHDVNISNAQRARKANKAGADLVIRIHADGNTNRSVRGISTLYPGVNRWTKPIAPKSLAATKRIHQAVIKSTGRRDRGIKPRTDLTGFNWSTVPVTLVETGFLSNKTEDKLLNTAAEQTRLANGITQGTIQYFTHDD